MFLIKEIFGYYSITQIYKKRTLYEKSSVVPTGLGLSINHFKQGFRATHSTACLETIVPNGTYVYYKF